MSSQPLLQAAPGMVYSACVQCTSKDHSLITFIVGKRIALPTRVEPKVFFANERTYLSWLNFTVILGALAVGMLNFGADSTAFWSAISFTAISMCTMVYATYTYHWRAKSIRQRGQAGFDDQIGPTLLAIALFVAVAVNFSLRAFSHENAGKKH